MGCQELKELVILWRHEALAVTQPKQYRKSACCYSTQMREFGTCALAGGGEACPLKDFESKASNDAF